MEVEKNRGGGEERIGWGWGSGRGGSERKRKGSHKMRKNRKYI